MAIINCPECKYEVSDRAGTCIKCGFPLQDYKSEKIENEILDHYISRLNGEFNFDVGPQVTNWLGDAALDAETKFEYGTFGEVEDGKIKIVRFKKGIKILPDSIWKIDKAFSIAYRQILAIRQIPAQELVRQEKSVIGRGIIGGIMLGGSAAIVGALSGLDKEKLTKIMVTEVDFYHQNLENIFTLSIRVSRNPSILFFNKFEKEWSLNKI